MAEKRESIGALWKKQLKSGELLTGTIEVNGTKVKIAVWPNKYKQEDKHPDYRIFIDDYKQEKENLPF